MPNIPTILCTSQRRGQRTYKKQMDMNIAKMLILKDMSIICMKRKRSWRKRKERSMLNQFIGLSKSLRKLHQSK